jgi:hypothetical protein
MRFTLRSFVLAPVVMALAAFSANTAMAETINVPFNFSVAGKKCPAGLYSVQKDLSGSAIKMRGAAQSFTWIAGPGDPAPTDKRVVLKFDAMGATHVLRSVQFGSSVTSRLDKKLNPANTAPTETVQGQ